MDNLPAPAQRPLRDAVTADDLNMTAARRALVAEWKGKIEDARDRVYKTVFAEMKDARQWATYGCDEAWRAAGHYRTNVLGRLISRKVADLYAKNPTPVVKRVPQMEGKLWDGSPEGLVTAMQGAQMGDPMAMLVMQEITQIMLERKAIDNFAKSLQIVLARSWDVKFKMNLKQAVRRACTCKVAWIFFDIFRTSTASLAVLNQIADTRSQLQAIEALQADAERAARDNPDAAEVEKLRLALATLEQQQDQVLEEGILYEFPRSDEVIVDPACTNLLLLEGANWLVREWSTDHKSVEMAYQVQLCKSSTPNVSDASKAGMQNAPELKNVKLWHVYDRQLQQQFVMCDQYPDFLEEPAAPPVYRRNFWPCVPLIFNETELPDDQIYGQSDIDILKDSQKEYNRNRQGLRQHRVANRPQYIGILNGGADEEEMKSLEDLPTHGILPAKGLPPGTKSTDIIVPITKLPVDMALYDTSDVMMDFQVAGGFQDANIGPAVGNTATESTIAEQGRSREASEDIDSLDDCLSRLAQEVGIMAAGPGGLSPATVQKIAGPGGSWPTLTRQGLADDLDIGIRAGSSGRPNKAQELANFERAAPFLMQTPGINPSWLARKQLERLEDDLDPSEALMPDMQSIVALNAASANAAGKQLLGAGQPAQAGTSDPNAQGAQGADKSPRPEGQAPGPQPAMGASGALGPMGV